MRDGNRTLQLRLRDIEVANDDFERQARNTTSSLEDLEYKYNVAIERGVLLEDEVKSGEQEREGLRIEAQRLRDELSDLKIEADIVNNKLRKAEGEISRLRKPGLFDSSSTAATQNVNAERGRHSPVTTASSPTMTTPPAKSVSSATSDAITPPSPTASESSVSVRKQGAEGGFSGTRVSLGKSISRPSYARHTRTPSIPQSNGYSTPSLSSRQSISRLSSSQAGIPRSGSLYQIRGLIGKMQKLEERVHSARSRLPAPVETPNRSPRTPSAAGQSSIPSSVTLRKSSRKRTSTGSASSSVRDGDSTPYSFVPQNRQSFGRSVDSRPSSRTSFSSRSSIGTGNHGGSMTQPRPESRQSLNRARTPLGHYSTNPTTESRRPRSSLSSYSQSHGPAKGMTFIEEDSDITTPTPRRGTLDQGSFRSSIPGPGSLKKRPSGSIGQMKGLPTPRRTTSKVDVPKHESKASQERNLKLEDLGETY